MNFNLLDNITLTCLTLGDNDEPDAVAYNGSIDPEIAAADDFIDENNPQAGLLQLSEEETKSFIAEMNSPTRSVESVVNGLAIASRCADVQLSVASLRACTQLAMTRSEELGQLGTCPFVAKIMHTHGSDGDVALQAFGTLIGLTQAKDNIWLMEKAGVAVQLSRLVNKHKMNKDVMCLGSSAILSYISHADDGEHIMANSLLNENLFAELLGLFDMKCPCSTSVSILENVCKSLILLCPASSTENHDRIAKLHPLICLSDAVIAVDGSANYVQLDGEPVTDSMRSLLQRTREHFHLALINTLNGKTGGLSAKESFTSKGKPRTKLSDRVSKADLLNVVMHLLTDLLQFPESGYDVKIRNFDDILNPKRVKKAKSAKKSAGVNEQPVVDQSKVLAFKNALLAALSDDEDREEVEENSETDSLEESGSADEKSSDCITMEGGVMPSYPLRAESHHSIRFDMPISLSYAPDTSKPRKHKTNGHDRSSGNLYFADLQYSMGMARCADYFDSLSHKEYSTAGLDDSTSSAYSTNVFYGADELDQKEISVRRVSSCVEKFRVAISLDTEHVDAMFALAILLLQQNNSIENNVEAEQLFKDIIALDPEYPKCYYNLGHIFFSRCQYGDSLTCFESAIAISKSDMEARVYRALCLTQLGGLENTGEAMREYKSILDIDRTNYLALFNLGVLLAIQEDFSAAILTFQNIMMNDPENVDTLSALAKSFLMRANQSICESSKKKAVSDKPVGFNTEHSVIIEDLRRSLRCYEHLLRSDAILMESETYVVITNNIRDIFNKLRDLS